MGRNNSLIDYEQLNDNNIVCSSSTVGCKNIAEPFCVFSNRLISDSTRLCQVFEIEMIFLLISSEKSWRFFWTRKKSEVSLLEERGTIFLTRLEARNKFLFSLREKRWNDFLFSFQSEEQSCSHRGKERRHFYSFKRKYITHFKKWKSLDNPFVMKGSCYFHLGSGRGDTTRTFFRS